jgi:hypothetical protein
MDARFAPRKLGKGYRLQNWEALEGESFNEVIRQVLTAGRSDAFCAAMDAEMNGAD